MRRAMRCWVPWMERSYEPGGRSRVDGDRTRSDLSRVEHSAAYRKIIQSGQSREATTSAFMEPPGS